MKIFIEYEKVIYVTKNVRLIILNSEEFISRIKENSKYVTGGHIKLALKYKLICNGEEYDGQSLFDSYKGISNEIDKNCPYNIVLKNWKLSDETEKYFNFDITKKEISIEQMISKKLGMTIEDVIKYSKKIEGCNATYFWNPVRGGMSCIVNDEGKYLVASSAVSFEKLLDEFKKEEKTKNLFDE